MRRTPPTGGLHPEITLTHTQEWELYHNSLSLCSKKLRVCLAELGLPCGSHYINLIETGAYENVSRHYLRVNPGGTVPVLVHNGHPVYESHDEIVYAAQHAGVRGRTLLPEDPETAALVAQKCLRTRALSAAVIGTGRIPRGRAIRHRRGHRARRASRVRTSVGAALSRRDASRKSARCRCWPARAGCNSS